MWCLRWADVVGSVRVGVLPWHGSVGDFHSVQHAAQQGAVLSNAPSTAVTAGRQADLAASVCVSGLSRGARL